MTVPPASPPDALLLIATGCPHCPAVLEGLAGLLKEGTIGRLEAINIAAHPETAAEYGVRSVPWLRLGLFELDGAQTPAELRRWAEYHRTPEGLKEYFYQMLRNGRRDRVERLIRADAQHSAVLADLMRNAETSMAVRLGIGAVLEEFHGSPQVAPLIPALAELSRNADALTRADACHFLALIGSAEVIPLLRACLEDPDREVRDIAAEALSELGHPT